MISILLLTQLGCVSSSLNRFTIKKVIPAMMAGSDLDMACQFGGTITSGVEAALAKKPAQKALILSSGAAGICAEMAAREAKLSGQVIIVNHVGLGPAMAAEASDARIRGQRLYATAAHRYYSAWLNMVDVYGTECKALSEDDQALFLFGLIAGDLSLITDAAGGTSVGVPQSTILDVARAAECLDSDTWWGVPDALKASAWATVPGSGPEGVDPWAVFEAAAAQGEASGMRIARSLQIFTAANAGRSDIVEAGLAAHGAAMAEGSNADWLLLDTYALSVSLFESDQLWIANTGHRTANFGTVPSDSSVGGEQDPFGDSDPFGGDDPFAAPAPQHDEAPDGADGDDQ
jgi:hypothetical protein